MYVHKSGMNLVWTTELTPVCMCAGSNCSEGGCQSRSNAVSWGPKGIYTSWWAAWYTKEGYLQLHVLCVQEATAAKEAAKLAQGQLAAAQKVFVTLVSYNCYHQGHDLLNILLTNAQIIWSMILCRKRARGRKLLNLRKGSWPRPKRYLLWVCTLFGSQSELGDPWWIYSCTWYNVHLIQCACVQEANAAKEAAKLAQGQLAQAKKVFMMCVYIITKPQWGAWYTRAFTAAYAMSAGSNCSEGSCQTRARAVSCGPKGIHYACI